MYLDYFDRSALNSKNESGVRQKRVRNNLRLPLPRNLLLLTSVPSSYNLSLCVRL